MGGEVDTESAVRRFVNNEQSREQQSHIDQRAVKPEPPQNPKPAASDAESITVNRWQDLQQQLGKRGVQPNDYSIPAVMRYRSGDDSDK